MIALKIIT
jgi:serine/threonine protein kinase